jgi:hypothetical protein
MGREAMIHARVGGEAGEVHAMLESSELILRGVIRRRYPKTAMERVRVDGDALCFMVVGEDVRLELGARGAASWAKAIVQPPPTLRAKLGLNDGARAMLLGTCDDALLGEALEGAQVTDFAQAAMLIARIEGPDDLAAAMAAQAGCPGLPIWAIYPKGKNQTFGEGAIRAALRAAGFRDTKSCAVSDRLTATRYARGSPAPVIPGRAPARTRNPAQ